MIDILHRADGIYNVNFNGLVRLGLAGISIQTAGDFGISTPAAGSSLDGSSVLNAYEAWLAAGATGSAGSYTTGHVRGPGLPTSQQVCLNHFFTHLDCGSTLGVAQIAQVGYVGGICEKYVLKSSSSNKFAKPM